MKIFKKVLSIVVCLMLVLSTIPAVFSVSAEEASTETEKYSVAFDQFTYDGSVESTYFSTDYSGYIAESDGVKAYEQNKLVTIDEKDEGYIIFKFSADEGKLLANPVLKWSGRATTHVDNRVDVYVSTALDGEYSRLGGVGDSSKGYSVNDIESAPAVSNLSSYVGGGANSIYVKMVIYRYGSDKARISTLSIDADVIDESAATQPEAGESLSYSFNVADAISNTNVIDNGGIMQTSALNTVSYITYKFDAPDSKLIKDVVLNWTGRGIQNTAIYVDIYLSATNNANDWTYLDGAGTDSRHTADNRESGTVVNDLKDYLGTGVETLYVKIVMRAATLNSWARVRSMSITGSYAEGTMDTETPTVVTVSGIEDGLTIGQGSTINVTASLLPIQLTDKTGVTVTSSNTSVLSVVNNSNVYAITGGDIGEATITVSRGQISYVYNLTVIVKSPIDENGNYTVDFNGDFLLSGGVNNLKSEVYSYLVDWSSVSARGEGMIAGAANVEGYWLFKFDATDGKIFDTLNLTWGGRAIQTKDHYLDVYVGTSADINGDWTYLSGVGHADCGYASNNTSYSHDLADIIADGVQTVYVKMHFSNTNQGWTWLSKLNVTGTIADGTAAAVSPNAYDATTSVTADNKIDAEMFEELDSSIGGVMSNTAGAAVKLAGVSFADCGANFVKATAAWGATGDGAASYDVYIDSIADANKIATLYAAPYAGSITKQTVTGYLDTTVTGTHDVYVVLNAPGSMLYDITFGNFAGDYAGRYTAVYHSAFDNVVSDRQVISYGGINIHNKGIVTAQGNTAYLIYRIDAHEGNYLTGINYAVDGRAIMECGEVNLSVSTDLKNWNKTVWTSTGDDTVGRVQLAYHNAESDASLGAETVYVKVEVVSYSGAGYYVDWNLFQKIRIIPNEAAIEGNFAGDADADGTVDVVDLIRFKKAAAGTDTTIAATAYFAGKNNEINDIIYTKKSILGIAFDVDRSRYDVVSADSIPATSPESMQPTYFEAFDLPVTTNADDTGAYNSARIQFCLDNYGFAVLQAGEYYELASAITLDGDGESLTSTDAENPAVLDYWGTSNWYVVRVMGSDNTLENLVINMNNNYPQGTYLDEAVLQINNAKNAVINNCVIMGGEEPETKDIDYVKVDENGDPVLDDAGNTQYISKSAGIYVLGSDTNGVTVSNSTIKNTFLGIIVHSALTSASNVVIDSCLVTYNRADGISVNGYATIKNCEVSYNGFDCMNAIGDTTDPVPGAGIYVNANSNGCLIEGNTVHHNNGNNIDVDGSVGGVIKNNNLYAPGNTSFPEAADYETVEYRQGVSLAIAGLVDGTVTGNTVSNTDAANVLSESYLNLYQLTDGAQTDVNGFFGYNNQGVAFADVPEGGNIIVACFVARSSSNTVIEGNTFIASADGVTGYGLFVDYSSDVTIGDNDFSGCDKGYLVAVEVTE